MISEWEALGRVAVALVLGGFIGFDRQLLSKPAGVRTHMLVAAGSALFIVVAVLLSEGLEGIGTESAKIDVSRMAAGVVTGVGFLGAGAIITRHDRVSGLTTAAGIWITAAIGTAIGFGFWIIGIGSTVAVLIIYTMSFAAEQRISGSRGEGPEA